MLDNQNTQPTSTQPTSQAFPLSEASSSFAVLEKRIEELSTEAEKAKDQMRGDFDRFEKRMDRSSNIMMTLTVIIVTVVLGASIIIALDYFNNNEQRYEKFIDKTDEIKKDFYTKEEVDKTISDFKKCLRAGGWNSCIQ